MDTLPDTLVDDQTREHENASENIRDGEDRPADDCNLQEGEGEELKQQDSGSIDEEAKDSRSDGIERMSTQDDSREEDEVGSDDGDSNASSDYEEVDPEMGPLVANRHGGPLSGTQREYNSFVIVSSPSEADHMASDSALQVSDSQADPEPAEDRPRTPEDQVAITGVEPDFTPRTARRLRTERERGYDRRFRPKSAVIALANDTIAPPRFPRLKSQAEQQSAAEEARFNRAKASPAAISQHEDRAHPQVGSSNRADTGPSRSPSPLRSATVSQGPVEEDVQDDDIDSTAPSSAFSDDSDSDGDDDTRSDEDESDGDVQNHDSQGNQSQHGDMTASIAAAIIEPDFDIDSEILPSGEGPGTSSFFAQVGATLAVPAEDITSNPPLSPVRTEFTKLESVPEEPDASPLNPVEYYPRFADAVDSPEVSPPLSEIQSINTKGKTPLYPLQNSSRSAAPKLDNRVESCGNDKEKETGSLEEDEEDAQPQASFHEIPSKVNERARLGLQEEANSRANALEEERVAFMSSDSISAPGDLDARRQRYEEMARSYQQDRDAALQLVQELKDSLMAQMPAENIENLQLQLKHSQDQLSAANEERDRQAEKSGRYKEACENLKNAYQQKVNKFNTYIDELQDRVQSLEDESQSLKDKNAGLEHAAAQNKVADQAQKKAMFDYREINRRLHERIEKENPPDDPQGYGRELEMRSELIADLEGELQHVSADLRKQQRQHRAEIQEQRDEFAKSQLEVEVWMEQHATEYKRTLQEKDDEIEALKLQLTRATERHISENDGPAIALQPMPPERAPLVKAQARSIDAVLANESYNSKLEPLPAAPLPGVPEPKIPKSPLSPLTIAPSDPQPWQDRVRDWRQSPAWQAQREALRQRRLAEAAHEDQYHAVKRAAYAVTFEKALPEREGDRGRMEKKNRLAFYENLTLRPKQQLNFSPASSGLR
ncbi:hypothetical protein AC579_6706 [Pseudocercospora musae]|uniref:Uncharacterized protein n=1 Tax=Pseudocercospora musae TaxID=113226 RepID=A0A139IHR5_9PEZI|nr:hypothetical protein AC579_6706 [Pseudocercospora musae]